MVYSGALTVSQNSTWFKMQSLTHDGIICEKQIVERKLVSNSTYKVFSDSAVILGLDLAEIDKSLHIKNNNQIATLLTQIKDFIQNQVPQLNFAKIVLDEGQSNTPVLIKKGLKSTFEEIKRN